MKHRSHEIAESAHTPRPCPIPSFRRRPSSLPSPVFLMGLWVFGSTAYHVLILGIPSAELMGAIGFLALVANVTSVLLLMKYKDGDANVRSVWLCSRNDAIGNVAVMVAAAAVWLTASKWPDLIVAALMAGLFLSSAFQILRQSLIELRQAVSIPAE